MKKKVYVAGHMLDKASQMLRAKERDDVESLGYAIYNPADNQEINDKATAKAEGLAERIVDADTRALFSSDVVVIEPQPYALGTHVELGQLLGMRGLAKALLAITKTGDKGALPPHLILAQVEGLCSHVVNKKVYPHMEDIRREAKDPEQGDRRSWAVNQYVYGACLKLTDGKGFYEWDEILHELDKAIDLEW